MKSRFILMSLAAAAMTMVSCVKDNIDNAVVSEVTLNAVTEGGQTKTALTGFADVVWSAGDQIAVYTGTAFKDFTLASGEGTASASFSGALAAGETAVAAVYPAAAKGADMGTVKYPAEYTYSEMGVNAPMVAEVAEGVLEFKHVGGVVKFDVGNIPPAAAGFVFTANSKITGDFAVTSGAVATSGTTAESVKISFTAGSIKSATFMVPLPTGTYTGFAVKFVDASGAEITGSAKVKDDYSFTITRAKLLAFPAFVDTTTPASKVLWEGEFTSSNYGGFTLANPNVAEGDRLRITYNNATEGRCMLLSNPNWSNYIVDDDQYINFDPEESVTEVYITADLAAAINEYTSFVFQVNNVVVTKIEYIGSVDPETVLWTGLLDAFETGFTWMQESIPVPVNKIKAGACLGFTIEVSPTLGWGNIYIGNDWVWEGIMDPIQRNPGTTYVEVELTQGILDKITSGKIRVAVQNIKLHKIIMK